MRKDRSTKKHELNSGPRILGAYGHRQQEAIPSHYQTSNTELVVPFHQPSETGSTSFRHFARQPQPCVKTAESTPNRFSRRFRARLPVMAAKSAPITSARFGPLCGWVPTTVLNQSSATLESSSQKTVLYPASSRAVRVSLSVSRKLAEASRAQGTGYMTPPSRSTRS